MIEFTNTGKRYRTWRGREIRALEDLTLEMRAGEVLGLAGPNGAGKSTLIALLMGFLAPSEGTVRIEGIEPRRWIERHGIGYLSELVSISPGWRTNHALRRFALLAGVPPDRIDARCEEVLALLGLGEHRDKRVRQLSKGNLQRLGLAQAMLRDERILVLDEPTHGLDPVWTQRFRDIVDGLRRPDRLILIASHNLDELARLADRVAIVDRGRLQRVVDMRHSPDAGSAQATPYRLVVAWGAETVAGVFPGARLVAPGEVELPPATLEVVNAGIAALIGAGVLVRAFHPVHSALEREFREAVGGGTRQGP